MKGNYMSIQSGLPEGFNPQSYDAIVVGAGYAGAVCARRMAEACGFKVAVSLVFSRDGDRVWECGNCGHIVIGPAAPDVCPVCDHPQAYFELRADNY